MNEAISRDIDLGQKFLISVVVCDVQPGQIRYQSRYTQYPPDWCYQFHEPGQI